MNSSVNPVSINRWQRWLAPVAAVALLFGEAAFAEREARAQSPTTAAIIGTVVGPEGNLLDGASVVASRGSTGQRVSGVSRGGHFRLYGLEVGPGWSLEVRRIGFRAARLDGLVLQIGDALDVQVRLESGAVTLDAVDAEAARDGGVATIVSDSLLQRLPTLNRNLYDFVRLAPQISTRVGPGLTGMSVAGSNFRLNNFLVNGVPQRSIGGNQPAEFSGSRTLPFDAVAEYELLVAPFDVRYGDFAGGLVNAVTRAGTNELRSSAFVLGRTDALAEAGAVASDYERLNYGIAVGGPIQRDRAHFFVAAELQRFTSAAPGPYVGQPSLAVPPVPVRTEDIARLADILRSYGLEPGDGGAIENENPLTNFFGRVDVALPVWNGRLIFTYGEGRARARDFSRPTAGDFPLSSTTATQLTTSRTASAQVHSSMRGGGHHQLTMALTTFDFGPSTTVRQPLVEVRVPGASGGTTNVVTGTPAAFQGASFQPISRSALLRDELTIPVGLAHTVTVGGEVEWFEVERSGVSGSLGRWIFASLDSLSAGVPQRYEVTRDIASTTRALRGHQAALFVGDQWRPLNRLNLTLGLRADLLGTSGRAPFDSATNAVFGRRTDAWLTRRVELSPRAGFTWDDAFGGMDLRGGIGLFAARPPVAWLHAPRLSYGSGIGQLRCGTLASDDGRPPPFDPRNSPLACANGETLRRGDVELLGMGLRMARTLRGTLALDRRLPWNVIGAIEGVASRALSDFLFVNLNLAGPQGVDSRGRVLYGTISPTGVAQPALRAQPGGDVIELRPSPHTQAWQLSARAEKRFAEGVSAMAHYTFSRVRDAQTPLRINVPGSVNWASRAVSGRHDIAASEISLNDVPHRVVLAGTVRARLGKWPTELSALYVGESGSPFTYTARGTVRGRGDLNADGSSVNDPIYVPRDGTDPAEILFAPFARPAGAGLDTVSAERQGVAFERFVAGSRCLRRRRGSIMQRNSCREPFSHTSIISVRQVIPVGQRALEAQMDLYNLLGLLDRDWGSVRSASPALLEHVAQSGTGADAQPVFRFDPDTPRWTTRTAESSFQFQFGLRFRY